jgi:chaperonin GroES
MIQPTEDRIAVLPDAYRDDITAAGLIVKARESLLASSQEHLGRTGAVMAVGPGKLNKAGKRIPLDVKVGDRIAFGEFDYREHYEDGQRYLIMQEADVCWVFENEQAA